MYDKCVDESGRSRCMAGDLMRVEGPGVWQVNR